MTETIIKANNSVVFLKNNFDCWCILSDGVYYIIKYILGVYKYKCISSELDRYCRI